MYCPVCGQRQATDQVRFCSRCGFLLSGVAEVIDNQGLLPNQSVEMETPARDSRKKRGVKQGVLILLIGLFLISPIMAMIHIATNTDPYFFAISLILSFFGGMIRIVYALMFEEGMPKQLQPGNAQGFIPQQFLSGKMGRNALPASQTTPANDYVAPKAGRWMTTNDLVQPGSITENTTKFLEKEEER
jgi:hypothetical protein